MVKEPSFNSGQVDHATEDFSDRRKYSRADMPLKARFLNENGEEFPCVVANISAGGAMVRAKRPPANGSKVVLYIDRLGRFEGKVVRKNDNVFAVSYAKRRAKAAKIADNLIEVMNTGRRSTDRRTTPRVQQEAPTMVRLEDGREAQCSILDISLTGASIEIKPRPPLGTSLILGRMKAKVVRRHEKGVGVVFTGSAEKMDEIIAETATVVDEEPDPGPSVAPTFGKKHSTT